MEVPTTVDEPAMMWVYDGDKWLEHPSGVDGAPGADGADGNIADATEQGVIATWDDSAKQWTPDSSLAIDSSGNVGIGTGAPAAQFEVKGSNTNARFRGVGSQMINVNFSETPSSAEIDFRNAGNFHISKQGSPALTIDSTGDAKFSSEVRSENAGGAVRINATDQGATSPYIRFWGNQGGSYYNVGRNTTDGNFHINVGANFDSPANDALTIDASGDAIFGGTVGSQGLGVTKGGTVRVDLNDTSNATGKKYLRSNNGRFDIVSHDYSKAIFYLTDDGNGVFNYGTVTDSTGRLAGVRDLIETLATLRNATKDETVDVRQALASACDKLIEKFEAMQSTATQEIES